ncbi:unnamed protein product [Eruca vesicaria subsp. sativa]|uniref:Uncharacterized protein n=1 Tax=Eruca vesicaria subsp. sativa TaxID=29727 RepID=A0ABC8KQ81_ERUVS|nr:unnamed protein product [Eruca vesicaria subsp. sativa]
MNCFKVEMFSILSSSNPKLTLKLLKGLFDFKLAFQASLYMIWKERNSRLHTQVSRSASSLVAAIQRTIREKLDTLSREQRNWPSTVTFLSTWLVRFSN